MTACVYVYYDPKDETPRYVGKSHSAARAWSHLEKSHNLQLDRMIKKRISEGFTITPQVIPAIDPDGANDLEKALIRLFGRKDIGTGTLFNHTEGGEGFCGMVFTDAHRARLSKANQERGRGVYQTISRKLSRPCTVDGITIYDSVRTLNAVLGQGFSGRLHPNFKFL